MKLTILILPEEELASYWQYTYQEGNIGSRYYPNYISTCTGYISTCTGKVNSL